MQAPENRVDSFHVRCFWASGEYTRQMSQHNVNTKQWYKTTCKQACNQQKQKRGTWLVIQKQGEFQEH